jgi:hypothetical protein
LPALTGSAAACSTGSFAERSSVSERPSRIAEARRRAADAKQAAVALAAAGFLAIALLARTSHPAQVGSAAGTSTGSPTVESQDDDDGFSLRPGQLGQSSGSSSGAQTAVS